MKKRGVLGWVLLLPSELFFAKQVAVGNGKQGENFSKFVKFQNVEANGRIWCVRNKSKIMQLTNKKIK